MQHITSPITLESLSRSANCMSPDGSLLVKAVVDIQIEDMIIGATMHVDEEEMYLDMDRDQQDLWGINLYPDQYGTDRFVEYDSMINLRP